jgi:hypothetical protein
MIDEGRIFVRLPAPKARRNLLCFGWMQIFVRAVRQAEIQEGEIVKQRQRHLTFTVHD